jgi:hypothetical protein
VQSVKLEQFQDLCFNKEMIVLLTRIDSGLADGFLTSKLYIDEINLELLVGLDTDQEWRPAPRSDDLVGEMSRLEDKRE